MPRRLIEQLGLKYFTTRQAKTATGMMPTRMYGLVRLAVQDRLLDSNPAEMLFTPPRVSKPSRRILSPEQVQQILSALTRALKRRRTLVAATLVGVLIPVIIYNFTAKPVS